MRAARSSERCRREALAVRGALVVRGAWAVLVVSGLLFSAGACESSSSPATAGHGDAGASGASGAPHSGGTGSGSGGKSPSGGAGGGSGGTNTSGAGGGADAECGNGRVEDGEACDDGKETSRCNANCTRSECGDGVHNPAANEECDDGGESARCNADCTVASCGDEKVNAAAGEECDGEFRVFAQGRFWDITKNYCPECKLNVCGDGVRLEPVCELEFVECGTISFEVCDTGGDSQTCNFDCTNARCGDGYTNEARGEQCDDGGRVSGDGCDSSCQLEPTLP